MSLQTLANKLNIGDVLSDLLNWKAEPLHHWKQGEFHHDHVIRIPEPPEDIPGKVLVVSTNCNGAVKEILCFSDIPDRWALWKWRCPENPEFEGNLPPLLDLARTYQYFNACRLLEPDTRSELAPEHRRRQRGGGWVPIDSNED